MIPAFLALLLCFFISIIYVSLLYVWDFFLISSPGQVADRNDPLVVLRRSVSAVLASFVAISIVQITKESILGENVENVSLFLLIGLRLDHVIKSIFLPLALTATLFFGPITWSLSVVAQQLAQDMSNSFPQRVWNIVKELFYYMHEQLYDILAWRNYVTAPLTEEIVFRACISPFLLWAGFSASVAIFIGPLFFGIAHVHHFWQLFHHQQIPAGMAAIITGVQLTYTTMFGWYAAFLFIRTGHLMSAIVAHTFCNIVGLPNVRAVVQHPLNWVFIPCFVLGVVAFGYLCMGVTQPSLYNSHVDPSLCSAGLGFCCWESNSAMNVQQSS